MNQGEGSPDSTDGLQLPKSPSNAKLAREFWELKSASHKAAAFGDPRKGVVGDPGDHLVQSRSAGLVGRGHPESLHARGPAELNLDRSSAPAPPLRGANVKEAVEVVAGGRGKGGPPKDPVCGEGTLGLRGPRRFQPAVAGRTEPNPLEPSRAVESGVLRPTHPADFPGAAQRLRRELRPSENPEKAAQLSRRPETAGDAPALRGGRGPRKASFEGIGRRGAWDSPSRGGNILWKPLPGSPGNLSCKKMFEELLGPGEEEEEEVTGDPSTQAGDPPRAGRDPVWPRVGAGCLSSSRTLSHPSCQPFYSAPLGSSRHPPLEDPAGPPPFLDCSSFFYTDPIQPPGYRIYNWLSSCSLDVLHRLHPETPAPIMATRETPPAPGTDSRRRRWFSVQELQAVSALMELPEAVAQTGRQAGSGAEQGDP